MNCLPKDAIPVSVLIAALMVFASWNQSYWWRTLDDDHFGWLTPVFAVFIIYDRRAEILSAWNNCRFAGQGCSRSWYGIITNTLATIVFMVGILAFVIGAADRAGGGHSFKGTFIGSFGVSLLMLSLAWLTAPTPSGDAAVVAGSDPRIALCRCLIFPAGIWLLSEPLLTEAETSLSSYVLAPIAATVAQVFDVVGAPISRQGNLLLMPDYGRVGVEEACSGIRSFSACLYAGSFLGALMLRKLWKQLLLLLFAVIVAGALNFLRTVFLTTWAYRNGTGSIEGRIHDTAGYLVLGLTVGSLFLLLRCFNSGQQKYR
jgi:exosortase